MSFAMEVKEEILNHSFTQEQKAMLLTAFIKYNGDLLYTNTGLGLKLSSNSNNVIRKIYSLLRDIYNGNIEISIIQTQKLKKNKVYELFLTEDIKEFLEVNKIFDFEKNKKIIEVDFKNDDRNSSLIRSYISGLFIASGSVNSPETSNYHLEFQLKELESANYFCNLLNEYGFNFKVIQKRNKQICYIKKSLEVSDFLKFMDASKSVLYFENTRITRDFNNNVNRMINIEIYNQQKSISAGSKQIEQIKLLKDKGLFNELSTKAQMLGTERLNNPEASFAELEQILNEKGLKITKSGISNLFKIIDKFVQNIGG